MLTNIALPESSELDSLNDLTINFTAFFYAGVALLGAALEHLTRRSSQPATLGRLASFVRCRIRTRDSTARLRYAATPKP